MDDESIFVSAEDYANLEHRVRNLVQRGGDIPIAVVSAFDMRTLVGPFAPATYYMPPAGARGIGAALANVGFNNVHVVYGRWNNNFQPSSVYLEELHVSSMQIHLDEALKAIADAHTSKERPLIIVGGPQAIYSGFELFEADDKPDVVVMGEEYTLLQLEERLLEHRLRNEPRRDTFRRLADAHALDDIPGLLYMWKSPDGEEVLVDTGKAKLLLDFSALPSPAVGLRLLQKPHNESGLVRRLRDREIGRHALLVTFETSSGCNYGCEFCPRTEFNQRHIRTRSPESLVYDILELQALFGILRTFGADDNMLADPEWAYEFFRLLEERKTGKVAFTTEMTINDAIRHMNYLDTASGKTVDFFQLAGRAGLREVFFGIEDWNAITAKKGQTNLEETVRLFATMRENGIAPMAMLMHSDQQPWRSNADYEWGLLETVRKLYEIGAGYVQVLYISPSPGSKFHDGEYYDGKVIKQAGDFVVGPWIYDGNYCFSSGLSGGEMARKQREMLRAYGEFYNWRHAADKFWKMVRNPGNLSYRSDFVVQLTGIKVLRDSTRIVQPYINALESGPIIRHAEPPKSRYRIFSVEKKRAMLGN
jgi:radical SAM superfamily enzyme YgiQ (UPF0313 family)